MDAPNKPVSQKERKTLTTSAYIWIGLLIVVSCIPLLNFVAIPIIMLAGLGAFLVYNLVKYAKKRDPIDTDFGRIETARDLELKHQGPGLTRKTESVEKDIRVDSRRP